MSTLKKELLRKLFHLLEVPIIAGYSFVHFAFSPQIAILTLTGLLLILLEFEYFRIDYQTRIGSEITRFFSMILRKHERNNVTSAISFVMSTIIAFSAFEYSIALLALLLTVFGDFAAALMGISFGKKKIFRQKSYVGTLSCLAVNIVIGALVLPAFPVVFLSMAAVAALVETLTQKLDDNLTVPLFAGFAGQVLVFWLQITLPPFF